MDQIPKEITEVHRVQELDYCLDSAKERTKTWKRNSVPRDLLRKSTVSELIEMAITDWLWIAALLVLVWNSDRHWYPLLSVLLAGRLNGLGVILHDATHLPLRNKNGKVRLLELLCGFPVASTLNAMRYHHIRHHRDSGLPTDPYFINGMQGRPWMYGLVWLRHFLLIPFWMFRSFYGTVANWFPGLLNSYGRLGLMDKSGQDLREHPEVKQCAREEKYQAAFFSILILLTWIWPLEFFLSYWIPVVIAGLFAGIRLLSEHRYIRVSDRSISSMVATTNDHSLGRFYQVFLAPHNIGYHLIHHIHPQVGIRHLPALRNWYKLQYPEDYPPPPGGSLAKI